MILVIVSTHQLGYTLRFARSPSNFRNSFVAAPDNFVFLSQKYFDSGMKCSYYVTQGIFSGKYLEPMFINVCL